MDVDKPKFGDDTAWLFAGLQVRLIKAILVIGALLVLVADASRLSSAQPASVFYGLQAATLFCLWLAVRVGSGTDMFRLAMELSNVALRPTWLPQGVFLRFVQSRYLFVACAYALVPVLGLTALWPEILALRVASAVVCSLFQLGESCRTSSHRDYLMVYNCWVLVFMYSNESQRMQYAQAVALGLVVHFILASGIGKLSIGGLAWAQPSTIKSILRTFAAKRKEEGGPILPYLNARVRSSNRLAGACAIWTVLFECFIAPLSLIVPTQWRVGLGFGMILLHLGIGILQSGAIGAFFLPCAASYIYGICASGGSQGAFDVGTDTWLVAVVTCVVLSLACVPVRGLRLMREDWPLTPYCLFPWSGKQWELLHAHFVEGSTRLILATDPSSFDDLVGRRVIPLEHRSDLRSKLKHPGPPGQRPPGDVTEWTPPLYDIWNRLVGVTTFQNDLLHALLSVEFDRMKVEDSEWDATGFTCCVEEWLVKTKRLVEISSGRALVRAYFVRVSKKCTESMDEWVVDEVICCGTKALMEPLIGG